MKAHGYCHGIPAATLGRDSGAVEAYGETGEEIGGGGAFEVLLFSSDVLLFRLVPM